MDDSLRFYLLSELSGHDESWHLKDHEDDILKSASYQIVKSNIPEVSLHQSGKSKALVYAFRHIKLIPNSFRELFSIQNAMDYLAVHSYPEYYLNPLAIDPSYKGEIHTLGELIIDYDGRDCSINEVILDEKHKGEDKKKELGKACDLYLSDMNRLIEETRSNLISERKKETSPYRERFHRFNDTFFFLLANLFLFFLLVTDFSSYRAYLVSFDYSRATSYLLYLYLSFTLLYDIVFALYHSQKARLEEPYRYGERYLRKNSLEVYREARKGRDQLYRYLAEAVDNHAILRNDITKFSKLSSAYMDFASISRDRESRKNRFYKVSENLSFLFASAELLAFLALGIILILNAAFNTVI